MSSINRPSNTPKLYTHGGTVAKQITPYQLLRRSVLSCLLWEKEFYEDGQSIAQRISETALKCSKDEVLSLAIEARKVHGLRHVPLILLLASLKMDGPGSRSAIATTISRPDELTEILALYWAEAKSKDQKARNPLDKQLQRGLADAFGKFNEYSLAKYDRDGAIKLKDVMKMCRPKPKNEEQAKLYKRVLDRTLETPETWEVLLSTGKDKKVTFEYLLSEGKIGYMALLRNLRNMVEAGCNEDMISDAILQRKGAQWVFPHRYVAAARACPRLEPVLDAALKVTIDEQKSLSGRTIVLVDVSGSMDMALSAKSDLTRMDAACTLASIINAESLRTFSFSARTVEVPPRRGMAGVDALRRSQGHSSTNLTEAIKLINTMPHERLIVITDEQATSSQGVPDPVCQYPYMINVASYRNGIGYGPWIHIDGFSESVIRFIYEIEQELNKGE